MHELADAWIAANLVIDDGRWFLLLDLMGRRTAGSLDRHFADDRLALLRIMVDVETTWRIGLGHAALPFMPEHTTRRVAETGYGWDRAIVPGATGAACLQGQALAGLVPGEIH